MGQGRLDRICNAFGMSLIFRADYDRASSVRFSKLPFIIPVIRKGLTVYRWKIEESL